MISLDRTKYCRKCALLQGVEQPDGTEATEKWVCGAYPEGIPPKIVLGGECTKVMLKSRIPLVLYDLEKGRKPLPEGTVREYGGMRFRKQGKKWVYVGMVGKGTRPHEFSDIDEAQKWGKEYNITQVGGEEMTLREWNEVVKEVGKIPSRVMEESVRSGRGIRLVKDSGITTDPLHAHLKGVRPRGWPSGYTWDKVPGVGGANMTIVVNRMNENHGSVNLILHEKAHDLDSLFGWTNQDDWQNLFKSTKWPTVYESTYAVEAFAESFAMYFHGEETRRHLPEAVKKYFAEVIEHAKGD